MIEMILTGCDIIMRVYMMIVLYWKKGIDVSTVKVKELKEVDLCFFFFLIHC